MKTEQPKTILLKDYTVPPFLISTIHLTFELDDSKTKVKALTQFYKNPKCSDSSKALVLNGEEMELTSLKLNGEDIKDEDFEKTSDELIIKNVPNEFSLEIENIINPKANTTLDGLYKSGNIFCSQCEPEGFRRITYYIDRPDVMAKFTTKIIGDKKSLPIMLSNGNPIDQGELDNGKHWIEWQDPFPKPCYLYALVAGDLGLVTDSFVTKSGRKIDLRIYCDKGNESKCDYAMLSLKNSMKWDEDAYGREYDLDIFMIVAVDSFNFGAMENKGLNIFNSAYVLADQKTATDGNFEGIESVVGHEYFHNWTGNRVTCRDWFQLTLKEGLTVFRDQEFSADMNSRGVQRIGDVERLCAHQFVEDAGPTAHPIKPDSYMEINNFYTATVYEKGAEIIRMIHTLLGPEGYRKGTDKYFELFDGQAVTTEDFIYAMSIANNNYDFTQFKNWYSQAGTPEVLVKDSYDENKKELTLTLEQRCQPTPGQLDKEAFHIPFVLGLVSAKGKDFDLKLQDGSGQSDLARGIVHLKKEKENFVFENISEKPILSLNRGFSAPISVDYDYSQEHLAFLMMHDNDQFNRYEAGQRLSKKMFKSLLKDHQEGNSLELNDDYKKGFGSILSDKNIDHALKAKMLSLPAEGILHQGQSPIDFHGTKFVRSFMKKELAISYENKIIESYKELNSSCEFSVDAKSIGKRTLKNLLLSYAVITGKENCLKMASTQFKNATNMTDEIHSFKEIVNSEMSEKEALVKDFYGRWKDEALVIQKWLQVQASAPLESTFENLSLLEDDPVFDKTIPNFVRSVVGAFGKNYSQFHHESGRGYKYIADKVIEMDEINPSLAAGISGLFRDFKKTTKKAQTLIRPNLERILAKDELSKGTYEIVSKILNS